jgi:tellurite resistance protein
MQGKTDASRAMRDLFLAAAVVIADAYEGISDRERAALKRFLGKAYAVDALDSRRLREDLPRRITEARKRNSLTQRMQVMRDICLIATTEKPVSDVELELLSEIATGLEVPGSFVTQCLDAPVELD